MNAKNELFKNWETDFDELKILFIDYFPCASSILGNKDWDKMKCYFKDKIINQIDSEKQILKSRCLLDDVCAAECSNHVVAFNFKTELKFIHIQIESALSFANSKEGMPFKPKIKKTIKSVLTTIRRDVNKCNINYQDYINEILVLNYYRSLGYKLLEIERLVDKNRNSLKRADFKFEDEAGNTISFDVRTIHGVDLDKINNNEDINNYIAEKAKEKLEKKLGGLENQDNIKIQIVVDYKEYSDRVFKYAVSPNDDVCLPPLFLMRIGNNSCFGNFEELKAHYNKVTHS